MLPRMMIRISGIATGRATRTRSRESSFSSVRVSVSRPELRMAGGVFCVFCGFCGTAMAVIFLRSLALGRGPAGQREERVLEVGLVHAQLPGHDLVARQRG